MRDPENHYYAIKFNPTAAHITNKLQLIEVTKEFAASKPIVLKSPEAPAGTTGGTPQTHIQHYPAPPETPPYGMIDPKVTPKFTASELRHAKGAYYLHGPLTKEPTIDQAPKLDDPDAFINKLEGKLFDWREFPAASNGVALSSEYLAYLLKFLPMATASSLIKLKGGYLGNDKTKVH